MIRRLAAIALVLGALPSAAIAIDWPARPVHIIAPSTAGGAADTFARILSDYFTRKFNAAFVVDNRVGGGGLIGVATTAHAEPDGYTLVISSAAYNTIEPFVSPNPGFDPAHDFTHIAYIGGQPNTFVVSAKSNLHSLQDVIARGRTGIAVNYVSPGVGTLGHLLMETMAEQAGIKLQHIPHRGSSQAMIDLVAGTVPLGTMTWGSAIGQIRAGTVLPVAVSADKPVAEYPNVPTLRSLGFDLYADSWFGLSGPAGMAPDLTQRLNQAAIEALALPEVKERLQRDAIITVAMTPAEFSALVADDIAKWGPIAKRIGHGAAP